jgi:hypothetical protein
MHVQQLIMFWRIFLYFLCHSQLLCCFECVPALTNFVAWHKNTGHTQCRMITLVLVAYTVISVYYPDIFTWPYNSNVMWNLALYVVKFHYDNLGEGIHIDPSKESFKGKCKGLIFIQFTCQLNNLITSKNIYLYIWFEMFYNVFAIFIVLNYKFTFSGNQ